ncbi:MAG TPA: hypothetical protein VHO91_21075 [Rhodopila sp.]|nr:hypothetical protein [Rhodopila sp.]
MRLMLSATVLALSATPVMAQNPQATAPQNPVAPVAPPNAPSPPPEQIAPPSGNLSNTLSKTHGTIKPPSNVDPGIKVTPRHKGTPLTPVIPPPGTPGGNQKVVPK